MKKISALIFMCSYILGAQQDVVSIGNLPPQIAETSGLIFYNDHFITHNDSGNFPQLVEFDSLSLQITRIVNLEGATNIDWEDIAQDDTHIYVADIGNFRGARIDLTIYKISKSDYDTSDNVVPEVIHYTYDDQLEIISDPESDWDAEALISIGENLIIFTKQWQSEGTVAYSLPKTAGNQVATRIGQYRVNGLITGATWNPISSVLYLVGYSKLLNPFLVRFELESTQLSADAMFERISLNTGLAQMEAITFVDVDQYYMTSELFANQSPPVVLDPMLFRFGTTDIIENTGTGGENPDMPVQLPENGETDLILYRTFGSGQLEYTLIAQPEDVFGRAIFDITGRLLQYTPASQIQDNVIDISTYGSSVYYLTFYLRNNILAKAFIAN